MEANVKFLPDSANFSWLVSAVRLDMTTRTEVWLTSISSLYSSKPLNESRFITGCATAKKKKKLKYRPISAPSLVLRANSESSFWVSSSASSLPFPAASIALHWPLARPGSNKSHLTKCWFSCSAACCSWTAHSNNFISRVLICFIDASLFPFHLNLIEKVLGALINWHCSLLGCFLAHLSCLKCFYFVHCIWNFHCFYSTVNLSFMFRCPMKPSR